MSAASPLPPDQAAREQALDIGHSALAIAPAGSGKTSLLVARMLACLAVSNEPEEVVAITFTRMAAAEIRGRLTRALLAGRGPEPAAAHERRLHALARAVLARDAERGWQLLENPNRLRALTIDALNAELAGRLPLLSGLGGPARMSEDARGLYEEAVTALFAELEDGDLPAGDRAALTEVLRWGDNRIDLLLDPLCAMLEKREQWLGPVLQLLETGAGADAAVLGPLVGARLQALDAQLDAADRATLLEILRAGSAQAETLAWAGALAQWPAAGAAQLETWQRIAGLLITQKGELRQQVDRRCGFLPQQDYTARMKQWLGDRHADGRAAALGAACAAVAACPALAYPPHLERQRLALARTLLRLSQQLRLTFSRRGEADFTEVALAALQALSGEHGYSEALDRADSRIRHLLVDEMQDTSEAQIALLGQLTSGWVPGDGHSLFMVGDPQQSIYAFRKAEVRLFLELWDNRRLGSVPLRTITLSSNFRSSRPLIEWFNRSLGRLFPETSDRHAGAVRYNPATAPAGAATAPDPALRLLALPREDDHAEAEAVVARLRELPHATESVAIIARARPHLWQVLAALRRHGIAYVCQDIDPLHDIPGVREYLHLARALWHAEDRLAWAVLLRSPLVGLAYADLVALSQGQPRETWPEKIRRGLQSPASFSDEGRRRLQRLQTVLAEAAEDPLLQGDLPARAEAVWHALGGPAAVTPAELREVRAAMRQLRAACSGGEIESLQALRRSLAGLYAAAAGDGGVQVLTAHRSKGLEFDHVLLVGCGRSTRGDEQPLLHYRRLQEGLLLVPRPAASLPEADPAHRLYGFARELHKQASDNELLRLLYVCCTRARRSLSLFVGVGQGRDGTAQAAPGSFARLLWPVIAEDIAPVGAALPEAAAAGDAGAAPRSPRLPPDYRFVADLPAWRPQERRSLRPSEAALDASAGVAGDGDLYARLVGTLYHEAMRKIATEGLARWADGGRAREAALAAGFRHLGLPAPQVPAAVARVLALLRATLDDEQGRRLLAPRDWAQSEYALAGYRDGRWIAAVIDRCFRDEQGLLWVVDYKTAAQPLPAAERDAYVDAALLRYREQLAGYAALLAELRGEPVRAALYFPDPGRLVELPL